MDIINIIYVTVGIIAGSLGMLWGFLNNKRTKLEAIKQYYDGECDELINARKDLYNNMKIGNFNYEQNARIGIIVNFYDKWGSLCLKGYLPIWIFNGAPGCFVVSSFNYIHSFVQCRRSTNKYGMKNIKYAYYYEKLAKRISEKYNIYPTQ